jgi:hypothetical protein
MALVNGFVNVSLAHHLCDSGSCLTFRLQTVLVAPTTLMRGAQSVGDPIAVLPVPFHVLWRHRLRADLSVPLSPDTTVVSVGASSKWCWPDR